MSATVVQLEIHWEWWIWRGYAVEDIDWDDKLADRMDHPAFDEATSFPVVKPSYDVFRPPCRSRKQRGWYQVKPWPHPHALHTNDAHLPAAAGKDVPPELFEYIIELVRDYQKCLDRDEKRILGSCALVCRFWADKCQAHIFHQLSLRSRQDVLELSNFSKDPACRFLRYNPSISISEQKVSSVPWIHLVSLHRYKLSSGLSLEGPLPAGWRSLRSIHQAVPRSLPRSFSRGISQLVLTNIRLRRLYDLMHLVSELPDLSDLKCDQVSWGPLPGVFPWKRISANELLQGTHKLTVSRGSSTWAQGALYLFPGFLPPSVPYFCHDDLRWMVLLARLLENVIASIPTSIGDVTCHAEFGHTKDSLGGEGIVLDLRIEEQSSIELLLVHVKGRDIPVHEETQAVSKANPSLCANVMAIDVREYNGTWLPIDWAELDNIVCSLPRLEMVIFGFDHREDMVQFVEAVINKSMVASSSRDLLRYAIEGGHTRGWLRAHPGSETTTASGTFDLIDAYRHC